MSENENTTSSGGCAGFLVVTASFYGIGAILSFAVDLFLASENILEPILFVIALPVIVAIVVATGGIAAFILALIGASLAVSVVLLGIMGIVGGAIAGVIAWFISAILAIIPIPGLWLLNIPVGVALGAIAGGMMRDSAPIAYNHPDSLIYTLAFAGFLASILALSIGDEEDETEEPGSVPGSSAWKTIGRVVDKSLDVSKNSIDKM